MGWFSKPETVILRESSAMKEHLARLEKLCQEAPPSAKPEIEKEIALTKAGIIGEEKVLYELRNSGMDMVVLHDLYLEADELSAQIDFYVITPELNFIIECKNLVGNIEVNHNGDFIRRYKVGGKAYTEGLYSPLTQNERHLLVLKNKKLAEAGCIQRMSISRYFEDFHKSLVVLANPKTVLNDRYAPKAVREKVVRADRLTEVMKKMIAQSKEAKRSKKTMREAGEKMLERHIEKDVFAEKYQKLTELVEAERQTAAETPVDLCPRCGKKLILRTARQGANQGNQFYGCSGYPYCRYIRTL